MDDDCSHEIKRRLLLGRKAITNLDSVLKCKDITLLTGLCSQSYGFSVAMYKCESWTIKESEYQGIDAFNCGVGEDFSESLGQQGDQTS